MTIPETLINKIHVGDCIAGMQELPSECANLIIADPPYNLSKDFGAWGVSHEDAKGMGGTRRIYEDKDLKMRCGKCHSLRHHIYET